MLLSALFILPCWKWTVPLSFVLVETTVLWKLCLCRLFKEKQRVLWKPFYNLCSSILFKEKQLVLWKIFLLLTCFSRRMIVFYEYWWHHWWFLFGRKTLPILFICLMGNVPMNSNLCLEFFLCLARMFSPTLYWWLLRRIFSHLLLRC